MAASVPRGAQAAAAAAVNAELTEAGLTEAELTERGFAAALAARPAAEAVAALQAAGIPAAVVADAAVLATDEHLWARGYYGRLERADHGLEGEYSYSGPPFGGGADADIRNAHPVGADSREILAEAGFSRGGDRRARGVRRGRDRRPAGAGQARVGPGDPDRAGRAEPGRR